MDQQEVINKLNGKGISNKCEKCGGEKRVNNEAVQILLGSGGNISRTFDGYAVSCVNCGHLDIFTAQHLN